jgi:hypothetical protein
VSSYAARQQDSQRIPWFGILSVLALIAGAILFFAMVVIPWSERRDARATLHDQQRLAVLHRLGFVRLTNSDLYVSSYYDQPTGFKYTVGSCRVELIIDDKGSNSRPYIWLKSIADTKLFVTYKQLTRIPQTSACFRR